MKQPQNVTNNLPGTDAETAHLTLDGAVDPVCDAFASKLRVGEAISIEDILRETNGQDRTTLLGRLILIELRYRWGKGEIPSLDEYLARFPAETETIQGLLPEIEKMARRFSLALMETVVKPEVLKTIGHFQIREVLGSGSFGTVWQAWDTKLKRNVAIKTITHYDDPARDLPIAMHEAQAVAGLHHPNIVRIFDVEEIEGRLCLISEYIEGVNLGKELSDGLLDFKKSAYICQRIAEALQHAHDHEVIHRDIKPTNILINAEGEPLLTDFGVAKYAHAEKTLSDEGKVVGSVRYMSPEQSRAGAIDGRSDVYSLGVVLYELLTGKPPFTGSIKEILFSHQFRDPKSPRSINPKIPRDLETICLKAMRKIPSDRYATAGAMEDDLRRYQSLEPIAARPLTLWQRSWRDIRNRPATSVIIFLLVPCVISSVLLGMILSKNNDTLLYNVNVTTEPAGAEIVAYQRDPKTGVVLPNRRYKAAGVTPTKLTLPPGDYFVVAHINHSGRFHEVYRYVPETTQEPVIMGTKNRSWRLEKDGSLSWKPIIIPLANVHEKMIHVSSGKADCNNFFVSPFEFTNEDFLKIRPDTAPNHASRLGKRDDAFIPSGLDLAIHFAEEAGGRLPTESEFETACWFNKRQDGKSGNSYVNDLLNGVVEWCIDYPCQKTSDGRIQQCDKELQREWGLAKGGTVETIRNGPTYISVSDPASRVIFSKYSQWNGLGFRLYRSSRPHIEPSSLSVSEHPSTTPF